MHGLNPLLKEKTENCVSRGLRYLFEEQETDGSWDNHPGITALAASAFLRSPIKSADLQWETSVNKALDYIADLSSLMGGSIRKIHQVSTLLFVFSHLASPIAQNSNLL